MFFGLGLAEVVIIAVIALLVFGGPALIGFWLGYRAGSRETHGQAGTGAGGDAPRNDDTEGAGMNG